MATAFEIKSTVLVNGEDLSKLVYSASRLSSIAKDLDPKLAASVKQVANLSYAAIEHAIADRFKLKKLKETPGTGYKPDFLYVDPDTSEIEASEAKSSMIRYINAASSSSIDLYRERDISLGSTIRIGATGNKVLSTKYSTGASGGISERITDIKSGSTEFVEYYKANMGNFNKHLLNPKLQTNKTFRKILLALSTNIALKAGFLRIPLAINKQQVAISTLKFSREFILNNIKGTISENGDLIEVTFDYPASIVNEALSAISKDSKVQSSLASFDKEVFKAIDDEITSIPNNAAVLDNYAQLVLKFGKAMRNKEFNTSIEKTLKMYQGNVLLRQPKRKTFHSTESSIIDITEYVRGRTVLKMRRGKGLPHPEKIYNRTGDFLSSIQAVALFRQNLVKYYYNPIYLGLERYGYNIDGMVQSSIRAIVQERFKANLELSRSDNRLF